VTFAEGFFACHGSRCIICTNAITNMERTKAGKAEEVGVSFLRKKICAFRDKRYATLNYFINVHNIKKLTILTIYVIRNDQANKPSYFYLLIFENIRFNQRF
jgi:hypothetical protein